MSEITIRAAEPADQETLAQFNMAMARESEGKELAPEVVRAGVRNLIEHPEHGFYLIAEVGGEAAGSLMITSEWSDWRNGVFWWIQSVYVQPAFRRRGVYRSLHSRVRQMALEHGDVCGIRLYVERDNEAAQTTYRSLGMRETGYLVYEEEFGGRSPAG